ncbi:MAG: biotin--[acetyl-CoA-carboxylase] ligase [Acidimicrobiales bacterium]
MELDAVHAALSGTRFTDVRWVARTGSTNSDLLEAARAGAPEGLVEVAEEQTAGRGRLDRTWAAPAGSSLLLSILLRPTLPLAQVHLVSTVVGIAASEACHQVAGVQPLLKWPNDLTVVGGERFEGRKLAGILAEAVLDGDRLDALVVGLGLNVTWPEQLPPELADIAVALNHITGEAVDRAVLLPALLVRLEHWYGLLVDGGEDGRAAVLARYRELSATIGRAVRAELPEGTVEGEAVDITDGGHLLVRTADGAVVEVTAGDVVHLRAAR